VKRLLIALAGLATVLSAADVPRIAADATVQAVPPPGGRPDDPDDNEEPPVVPHGLHFRWPAPAATLLTYIAAPVLPLEVVNLDEVSYRLQVRTREDAGSLQTRRISQPIFVTIAARSSTTIPIRFGAQLPAELTHSGMFAAFVAACPADGDRCIAGGSDPLFFHQEHGTFVVYGEEVLCRQFSCGALRVTGASPERGTWRVMGGGALLGARVHEEPDATEPEIVGGGR
jgi:hypothetical protein